MTLTPPHPVTVGIDVGGTKMLGVALDGDGTVFTEIRSPTPHHRSPDGAASLAGPDEVLDAIAVLAEQVVAAADGSAGAGASVDVEAFGVGLPGLVDDAGVLRFAPNLMHGQGMHVADRLTERLGRRVVADNDATCAAVGEWAFGAAARADNAVLITLGTGIGGGIILDGQVRRGANGFAAEVGHMVVDPDGPQCTCGKRGCWERYASGAGLARLARIAALDGRLDAVVAGAGGDPEAVRGEHVTSAAAAGDPQARAVLADLGWWLALGLSNLANILDPSVFVVGGGLIEAGTLLLDPVRSAFSDMVEASEHRPDIAILPALLGERAGAIGAAVVAREADRRRAGSR